MNSNKLTAMIAGTLLLAATSICQIGTIRYDHDEGNDSANCIAMDGFGNTYVAGTVTADGEGTQHVGLLSFVTNFQTI
ncbi:MAG TPA: hypothetical protein PKA27_12530 [Fimbriimonadaceae bacterium]|nr:hypothetical protein [Fimbriimonadaceae bacterium]